MCISALALRDIVARFLLMNIKIHDYWHISIYMFHFSRSNLASTDVFIHALRYVCQGTGITQAIADLVSEECHSEKFFKTLSMVRMTRKLCDPGVRTLHAFKERSVRKLAKTNTYVPLNICFCWGSFLKKWSPFSQYKWYDTTLQVKATYTKK